MTGKRAESIEQIVQELLQRRHDKHERMRLLRELARSSEEIPDALMDAALRRLMERLPE